VKTTIRKVGNSHGIIIPLTMLAQAGIQDEAEMLVEKRTIVLRKPRKAVRAGWAEASRRIAAAGGEVLIWGVSGSAGEVDVEWS
jgi:antitoxin MazE